MANWSRSPGRPATAPGSRSLQAESFDRPVVIVGPTAVGKSAVALELARAGRGHEIVSVDSMQVYRGMDIGTAKPSAAEQAELRHHLIDLVDPDVVFSVVDFSEAWHEVQTDLARRDVEPVIVGGTGLYLRAVVDGLTPPPSFQATRLELEQEPDTVALYRRLEAIDPKAAARMEPTNRRRVVRALEVTIGSGRPFSSYGPGLDTYPVVPFRLVGVDCDRAVLDQRIEARYVEQMERGLLDEVQALLERPGGFNRTAGQALGYKEISRHLAGELSLDEAVELASRRTRRFARRQQRWFRRDPRIEWHLHDGNPLAVAERLLGD